MRILLSAILSFAVIALYGQKMVPEATELYLDVPVVTPGEGNAPPSDAIVLFDGTDVSKFQMPKFNYGGSMKDYKEMIPQLTAEYEGKPIVWEVKNGEMIVRPSGGPISTKQAFGDVQLHIEWLAPKVDGKSGQGYSNSGVFLMGLYEVQVLNSYENPTYSNGQAASIYKQF
ncbi:MAG: DUF1080 domain-containing protein, partial [Cyclobacteriaceae bacterium]|nr:DUF1080 domain-containing protein [Cyclobacteriaceae bacterium]